MMLPTEEHPMTSIDLESLPYPMFTTTEEEKECLREAYHFIKVYNADFFLCLILKDIVGGMASHKITDKIQKIFGYDGTLNSYLEQGGVDFRQSAEMRRIWIRKLLKYTGE
jgi:hypothetical protein